MIILCSSWLEMCESYYLVLTMERRTREAWTKTETWVVLGFIFCPMVPRLRQFGTTTGRPIISDIGNPSVLSGRVNCQRMAMWDIVNTILQIIKKCPILNEINFPEVRFTTGNHFWDDICVPRESKSEGESSTALPFSHERSEDREAN